VRYTRIDAGDASPEELIRSLREGGGVSVEHRSGSRSSRRGEQSSSGGRAHRRSSAREPSIGEFIAEEDPYMYRTSSGRSSSGAHRSHRSSRHRSSRGVEPEEEYGMGGSVPQQRGLASG